MPSQECPSCGRSMRNGECTDPNCGHVMSDPKERPELDNVIPLKPPRQKPRHHTPALDPEQTERNRRGFAACREALKRGEAS